ncbi:MAG: hypothetical protein KIT83_00020 [Bryobacterales bacterium]|nr:hypothetical protein [Bryobacterales bacterium]
MLHHTLGRREFSVRALPILLSSAMGLGAGASPSAEALDQQPNAAAGSGMPFFTLGLRGEVLLAWTQPAAEGQHALLYSLWRGKQWEPPQIAAQGAKWFVNWADFGSMAFDGAGQRYAHWLARAPEGGKYGYGIRIGQQGKDGRWREIHAICRDEKEDYAGFLSFVPLPQGMGAAYLAPPEPAVPQHQAAHPGHGGHDNHDHRKTLRLLELNAAGRVHRDTLLDDDVCSCCQTAALATSNAIWVAYRDHRPGEIRDISVIAVRDGVPGEPRTVHPDGWQINGCPTDGPAMDRDETHAAIVWFTRGGGAKVQVAFSPLDAPSFGAPVRVDDGNPLGRASLRAAGEGRYVIVWLESLGEGKATLRVRAVHRTEGRGIAATLATVPAARTTGFPQLLVAHQELFVAWREDGIRVQRMPLSAIIPKEWK